MKKLLVLSTFLLSATAFAAAESELFSELQSLEQDFQSLSAQEEARFNEEKSAADAASQALAQDQQLYSQLSERASKLSSEANTKFYKDQYEALASKYEKALKQLSQKMESEKEVISNFEKIQSIRGN